MDKHQEGETALESPTLMLDQTASGNPRRALWAVVLFASCASSWGFAGAGEGFLIALAVRGDVCIDLGNGSDVTGMVVISAANSLPSGALAGTLTGLLWLALLLPLNARCSTRRLLFGSAALAALLGVCIGLGVLYLFFQESLPRIYWYEHQKRGLSLVFASLIAFGVLAGGAGSFAFRSAFGHWPSRRSRRNGNADAASRPDRT